MMDTNAIPERLPVAGRAPHMVEAVELYNSAVGQIEAVAQKRYAAEMELFRTKKLRDEASVELKKAQAEMDVASRDKHELDKQLEKLNETFGQIQTMVRGME